MKCLVSSCLLGENVKYSGENNRNDGLMNALRTHTVIPICPEVMGGLPTPRTPVEQVEGIARNKEGVSFETEFQRGAHMVLEIAKREQPDLVILQARSPSCGVNHRYDGTFSGTLIPGSGITAALLKEHGFAVYDTEDIEHVLEML